MRTERVRARTLWVLALLPVLALPGPSSAQTDLSELPGYFPTELLELVPADAVSVEVNLQGAMLKMIGAFAGDAEPEFASLVAALDAIRVRSGEFDPADAAEISRRLAAGQSWLSDNGWLAMVRVRDGDEEVYVYSREEQGDLVGFTILALEGGEATAVNLIGRIDPQQLQRLISGLDLGVLEDVELGDLEAD